MLPGFYKVLFQNPPIKHLTGPSTAQETPAFAISYDRLLETDSTEAKMNIAIAFKFSPWSQKPLKDTISR
jgi:hypothetical protein